MRSRAPGAFLLVVGACAAHARPDLGPIDPINTWLVELTTQVEAARAACADRATAQLGVTLETESGPAPPLISLVGTVNHRGASHDALLQCLDPRLDAIDVRAGAWPHARCLTVVTPEGGTGPWLEPPAKAGPDDASVTIGLTSCWTREWRTIVVDGAVEHPGSVPYRDGMTLTDALAAAGGRSPLAAGSVWVKRGARKVKFSLGAIHDGRRPDPVLAPSDVVQAYIPD